MWSRYQWFGGHSATLAKGSARRAAALSTMPSGRLPPCPVSLADAVPEAQAPLSRLRVLNPQSGLRLLIAKDMRAADWPLAQGHIGGISCCHSRRHAQRCSQQRSSASDSWRPLLPQTTRDRTGLSTSRSETSASSTTQMWASLRTSLPPSAASTSARSPFSQRIRLLPVLSTLSARSVIRRSR